MTKLFIPSLSAFSCFLEVVAAKASRKRFLLPLHILWPVTSPRKSWEERPLRETMLFGKRRKSWPEILLKHACKVLKHWMESSKVLVQGRVQRSRIEVLETVELRQSIELTFQKKKKGENLSWLTLKKHQQYLLFLRAYSRALPLVSLGTASWRVSESSVREQHNTHVSVTLERRRRRRRRRRRAKIKAKRFLHLPHTSERASRLDLPLVGTSCFRL